MYRKVSKKLNEWIKSDRRAMLVTGARQIGKTYIIRETLKNSGYNYFEINFIENPEFKSIFDIKNSIDEMLLRLKAIMPSDYKPNNTIIFLDEVQECNEVITKIKFLVDEGSFKYILSGSLLGVELKNIRSAPVGYMTILDMYQLDFEEFLIAMNRSKELIDAYKDSYKNEKPVDDFIHNELLTLYYKYLVIGGMPNAVKTFIETEDLRVVKEMQNGIKELYKKDFSKYEKEDKKLELITIYNLIAAELNDQNRRFVINDIDEKSNKERLSKYNNSFLWLKEAGVAYPIYNVTEPKAPLMLSMSSSLFKLYYNDTGLLVSNFSPEVILSILDRDGSVNNGCILENAICQALSTNGHELYYYNRRSAGEVDFIIEKNGKALPIEVKSGRSYRLHKALDNMLEKHSHIDEAIVLCNGNVERDEKILYLPVYMAGEI